MSQAVQQLEQALSNQPANPLRHHQVEEYTQEAARLNAIVTAPAYVMGADRGEANKRARRVKQIIEQQVAKPLTGEIKDKVAKLAEEVMERHIRPALLPREEMRRNPAGAVGRFLKQENSTETQHAIQQWKRAQLALEQGNPDPDLANVERFRPELMQPGTSTHMVGAQIPGVHAMTPQAKENWPLGEPTIETPLKTAQKRERTPAQIDALARAQVAAKAKRQKTA